MADAHAVALKLPTFWASHPRVWFAQAEAQFATRNITGDDTRFHYVVAALDQDTASRLLDLLDNPPAAGKYNAIKDRLVATFALSRYERAGRLLDLPELGDERPSALMDKMLALLGDHPPCFLFHRLFLDRMPESIRGVLVHSGEEDSRALAKRADQLWEAQSSLKAHAVGRRGPWPTLKEKSPPAGPSPAGDQVADGFRAGDTRPRRGTGRSRPRAVCSYHSRWGAEAIKCQQPCAWPGNGPAGH